MTTSSAAAAAARAAAAAHRRLERLLADAMRAPDPAAALRAAAGDRRLPTHLRRALRAADPDGVRMTALLCARLRFERLLRASPEAESWFDRDPAGFTAAFRSYHQDIPPTAFTAQDEGVLFARYLQEPGRA